MLVALGQDELWKRKHNSGDSAVADSNLPSTERVNPAAMSVEGAARALGLSVYTVRADLAAGAPSNADGTMNLVHYAAWLNGNVSQSNMLRR
jgi:hypothetical protein